MIRIHSQTQLTLDGFEAPFERSINKNNHWVNLSVCIPWDELQFLLSKLQREYCRTAKEGRLVVGAVIIKHRLKLSASEFLSKLYLETIDLTLQV